MAEDRRDPNQGRGNPGRSGKPARGRAPRGADQPTDQPTGRPTGDRTGKPTGKPTGKATGKATGKPTRGDTRGDTRGGTRGDTRGAGQRRGPGQGTGQGAGRGAGQGREGRREGTARDVDQARYDGPELPAEITGAELDRNIAAQLRGLPEKLAARVARHLVAAGTLIDTDPETAYQHALAARARASRVAVVREATGEAAYAAGHYAEALAELRAAKRMNGAIDYLPVMADCERALHRPERALELARSTSVDKLPHDQQIEMTIVEAGARHDLGETTSALRTLENAPLRSASREEWVVRLRYAYADLLAQAGRTDDAIEWFHRTAAIDSHQTTDATTRLEALTPQG